MLYPFKLKPLYKEKIWGGKSLQTVLGKEISSGKIGESWEISDHDEDTNIIENGDLAGLSLHDIFLKHSSELMGERLASIYKEKFPLLIKFIDAEDKLSIQVHPNDDYAEKNENGSFGKTEAWYIVHAEPNAFIIAGLNKQMDIKSFEEALKTGKIEDCVNKIPIKTGDFIFIPAGRIHAIMPGILINEIQQNSDITYRVYDWNRLDEKGEPRTLHIRQSLETINFKDINVVVGKPVSLLPEQTILIENKFFTIEKLEIKNQFKESTHHDNSFHTYSVISGQGTVESSGQKITVRQGDSFIVPYITGEYKLIAENPEFTLIKTYI